MLWASPSAGAAELTVTAGAGGNELTVSDSLAESNTLATSAAFEACAPTCLWTVTVTDTTTPLQGGAGSEACVAVTNGYSCPSVSSLTITAGDSKDVVTQTTSTAYQPGATLTATIELGAGDDSYAGSRLAESLAGGDGVDSVSYGSRTTGVCVSLNGPMFDPCGDGDGQSGENDAVGDDIETVIGSAGNDRIYGSTANNVLAGGSGNDTINPGSGGTDTMVGGAGTDRVTYSDNGDQSAVRITLDGRRNDGPPPYDDKFSYFERFAGSPFNDVILGNSSANIMSGSGGADSIQGGGGNDRLYGDMGRDKINGGGGKDNIQGGSEGDNLTGGPGNDRVYGQDSDQFNPASNIDVLRLHDKGGQDIGDCGGKGNGDQAYIDRADVARNCRTTFYVS
jgi:Ca2+-binding RTX toxin-like protein